MTDTPATPAPAPAAGLQVTNDAAQLAAAAPGAVPTPAAIDAEIAAAYAKEGVGDPIAYEAPTDLNVQEAAPLEEGAEGTPQAEGAPAEAADTGFSTFAQKYAAEMDTTGTLTDASIQEAASQLNIDPSFVSEFARLRAFEQATLAKQNAAPPIATPGQPAPAQPTPAEVAAQQNQQQQAEAADPVLAARAFEAVGGSNNWAAFSTWASTNLTPVELANYEAATPAQQVALVEIYGPRFKAGTATPAPAAQQPAPARSVVAEQPSAGQAPVQVGESAKPFTSEAEATSAYADKRYNTDAAYRASVLAREVATNRAAGRR
jgi:hypothetical protein